MQSAGDLFLDILDNNVKFKFLIEDFQENATTTSEKTEIFIQLTLLSEILEKKMNNLLINKNKFNPDYLKLKKDTMNILQRFKKFKFMYEDSLREKNSNTSMNYDENIELDTNDEEIMEKFLEIPLDREEDINKLCKELHTLHQLNKETEEIIANNKVHLDIIEMDVEKTKAIMTNAVGELKIGANEAIKKRKNYIKIFFSALGGIIGIQAGPVGIGVGAIAGGCVGGLTSMSLNPLQSKIKKI